jgi:hypothetical protein
MSYFGRLPLHRRSDITVIGGGDTTPTGSSPNPSDFCPHCSIHYSRWKGEENIMFCGKCLHNLPQKYREELEEKMKNKKQQETGTNTNNNIDTSTISANSTTTSNTY